PVLVPEHPRPQNDHVVVEDDEPVRLHRPLRSRENVGSRGFISVGYPPHRHMNDPVADDLRPVARNDYAIMRNIDQRAQRIPDFKIERPGLVRIDHVHHALTRSHASAMRRSMSAIDFWNVGAIGIASEIRATPSDTLATPVMTLPLKLACCCRSKSF